ncbi:hypothetical protein TIFTF001_017992 [Ficus carica]|uniref:FLZ-type domain-containing protein n=1 Tax=Ficus carica TaxID=3494 RepID=A0AA88DJ51_FICCA|nr:hypothetical protein TIFTF001_017992 [Ficus carica]
MATKRSRVAGTYGNSGVINQLRPPATALIGAQTAPAVMESSQFRRGILTLSPPELVEDDFERQVPDNFLEKCWYCHNKIAKDKDVFMYCHFRAFCTRECRDVVIEMDNALDKVANLSSQFKAKSSKKNNSEW